MKRSVLVAAILLASALIAGISVGAYIYVTRTHPVDQALDPGPTPTAAANPEAQAGCDTIQQAASSPSAADITAVETAAKKIAAAAPALAIDANGLAQRAVIARAATGARDEGATRIELNTAVLTLATACSRAGY